jgi:hypothetical protein
VVLVRPPARCLLFGSFSLGLSRTGHASFPHPLSSDHRRMGLVARPAWMSSSRRRQIMRVSSRRMAMRCIQGGFVWAAGLGEIGEFADVLSLQALSRLADLAALGFMALWHRSWGSVRLIDRAPRARREPEPAEASVALSRTGQQGGTLVDWGGPSRGSRPRPRRSGLGPDDGHFKPKTICTPGCASHRRDRPAESGYGKTAIGYSYA